MTTRSVRIPDEIDLALTRAAEAEHISVNGAIVQAVQSWTQAQEHRARIRAVTAQVMAEDSALLARLADA